MDRKLDRALWGAQWTLAVGFHFIGMCKLGVHAQDIREHFGFVADVTTATLHRVGTVEAVLAVLVVLPALLEILPRLSLLATAALGAIAVLGTVRPATTAGTGFVVVNAALLALAMLVVSGRIAQASAAARAACDHCPATRAPKTKPPNVTATESRNVTRPLRQVSWSRKIGPL